MDRHCSAFTANIHHRRSKVDAAPSLRAWVTLSCPSFQLCRIGGMARFYIVAFPRSPRSRTDWTTALIDLSSIALSLD